MDNYKKEIRNSILILAAIVVFFGVFMFFASGRIQKLGERVAGVQGTINQERTITSQLVGLREDKELSSKYETVIQILIPKRRQLFDLQRWLTAQAQSHGVQPNFSYAGDQKDPQGNNLGELPFLLKLSGDTSNLIDFLDFLENRSPQFLMFFEDSSISSGREGASQMALKGKIFFRADE